MKNTGLALLSILFLGLSLRAAAAPKPRFSLLGVGFAAPEIAGESNVPNPEIGAIILDSTTSSFKGFDGTNWQDFGGSSAPNLAVRSVTSTDTATTSDNVLLLSSSSFTETLYTAVGNTGKVLELVHNGTSLSQVYTLQTTAGQTIGGVAGGSYALYTNGERLKVVSDGSNWVILSHESNTNWTSYTPSFTGVGSPSNIDFRWRRVGTNIEIRGFANAGTVTSSNMTVSLPTGASIDSSTVGGSQAQSYGTLWEATSAGTQIPAAGRGPWAVIYNTLDNSAAYFSGSANSATGTFAFSTGTNLLATGNPFTTKFSFPISGWQP